MPRPLRGVMDEKTPVHVLIFPFPLQGHINPMRKLTNLLCSAGIRVTFLNTEHSHHRLLLSNPNLLAGRPGLCFRTISDGLPPEHPRSGGQMRDFFISMRSATKQLLHDMLAGWPKSDGPPTCIVADGLMTHTIDVAEEVGIPILIFRTGSACSFWTFFCGPKLAADGEIPFQDDMDRPVRGVAGMEAFLRCRDLPSLFRVKQLDDPFLQLILSETQRTTRASGIIFNSSEHLEGSALAHIRPHMKAVYAVGPIHALESRLIDTTLDDSVSGSSSSLWAEDKTCLKWLDAQPCKSVLYVSFGSIAVMSQELLLEVWHGLVNSQTKFLWVIRPDQLDGGEDVGEIPEELRRATGERGCVVAWAPQVAVLGHPAVGGFFTHGGWNSTLESLHAGIPMICWPFFADQTTNSRFVQEVWKIGLDMKDRCDRETVEMMIRDLMGRKREEMTGSAIGIADLSKRSVSPGGPSYLDFNRLVVDIRSKSQDILPKSC